MPVHSFDQAIQAARRDVEATPQNHFMKAIYLNRLADLLGKRYSASGELRDLEESISVGRTTLESVMEDDREMPIFLNTLAIALCEKYRIAGTEADLNEGIELLERAIHFEMTTQENAAIFGNLGVQLGIRYSKTGALADLGSAIMAIRGAQAMMEPSSPEYSGQLNNLAIYLGSQYLSTGALRELEEAIRWARQSVNLTPSDHSDRPRRLNNLGIRIYNRYSRIGAMHDLNEAMGLIRQAIDAAPEGSADNPMFLNNLSCLLNSKYARTNDLPDLDESISIARTAVAATPHGHPEEATRRNNLANWLGTRFSRLGHEDDIEEAIRLSRDAVSNLGDAHPDKPRWSNNLALQLGNRYLKTKQVVYLEEAVGILKATIESIHADHPDRSTCLHNLGTQLKNRFSELKEEADLEQAICATREAVENLSSPTITRALCGGLAMDLCALKSDWSQALEIADLTISLIPKLSARSLTNLDKQHMLSRPYGLACNAAAIALQAEQEPSVALNFLEQGRAVLAESLQELRVDVRELLEKQPGLAKKFCVYQEELDSSFPRDYQAKDESRSAAGKDIADRRYKVGNAFDTLVTRIREQPGFEGFLKAPTEAAIKAAAEYGPIVVINVSDYRCDAIIVEQQDIKCLLLPNLTKSEIQNRAQGDLGSSELLEWLWDTLAEPILNFLGFREPPLTQDKWPRVWWVPTGVLTKLPIHAAGYHSKGSFETGIDRVMSSYSSSIKAIIRGRQRPHELPTQAKPAQALLVAMEHTARASTLPFATREVATLHGPLREMSYEPLEPGTSKADVIAHLPESKIFHFAGHGSTNEKDPSKSHLMLAGEGVDSLLTVGALFEMNLHKTSPFLAYLSACETGRIEQDKFMDENIHLISAFQLAGFRHAIGTLWEVNDENCVDVAKTTYEKMRDEALTDESVCMGLHQACLSLRDRWISAEQGNRTASIESGAGLQAATASATDATNDGSEVAQTPRNLVLVEESLGSAHWAPYVHFGV